MEHRRRFIHVEQGPDDWVCCFLCWCRIPHGEPQSQEGAAMMCPLVRTQTLTNDGLAQLGHTHVDVDGFDFPIFTDRSCSTLGK
jgi:hypothetical protein